MPAQQQPAPAQQQQQQTAASPPSDTFAQVLAVMQQQQQQMAALQQQLARTQASPTAAVTPPATTPPPTAAAPPGMDAETLARFERFKQQEDAQRVQREEFERQRAVANSIFGFAKQVANTAGTQPMDEVSYEALALQELVAERAAQKRAAASGGQATADLSAAKKQCTGSAPAAPVASAGVPTTEAPTQGASFPGAYTQYGYSKHVPGPSHVASAGGSSAKTPNGRVPLASGGSREQVERAYALATGGNAHAFAPPEAEKNYFPNVYAAGNRSYMENLILEQEREIVEMAKTSEGEVLPIIPVREEEASRFVPAMKHAYLLVSAGSKEVQTIKDVIAHNLEARYRREQSGHGPRERTDAYRRVFQTYASAGKAGLDWRNETSGNLWEDAFDDVMRRFTTQMSVFQSGNKLPLPGGFFFHGQRFPEPPSRKR